MDFNEYQTMAYATASRVHNLRTAAARGSLGLCSEAGEIAGLIEKTIGQGHPLNLEELQEELGDTLWYLAVLAKNLGLSLDEVAKGNIAKLAKRYPAGTFTTEDSQKRRDGQ